jgi:hypothetical protein
VVHHHRVGVLHAPDQLLLVRSRKRLNLRNALEHPPFDGQVIGDEIGDDDAVRGRHRGQLLSCLGTQSLPACPRVNLPGALPGTPVVLAPPGHGGFVLQNVP